MGTRVYIGRLSYNARERDVERFFKGYGRIRDVMLKNGYGFVEFDDYRDADDAVYELNGKDLCGERVIVEHARGPMRRGGGSGGGGGRDGGYRSRRPSWIDNSSHGNSRNQSNRYGPPTRTEYRLVVENLSSRVSWQDLKDYMRQAGEVTYADAHKQRKNEGVVEFATYSDLKNALDKLDDTDLNGRRIKLVEDKSRSSRRRSHSNSRSRSRSHSRSRSRSKSRSRSRSRSRSPRSKSRSKSRSRSRSPRSRSRSASHAKSASRSKSKSPPPQENGEKSPAGDD
ncbi:serine/arginine-rich splicing factor 6 isoform X2 [Lingula anatina]|uniref:Serine/arginine-rich splicing factor 6 isoform X2 n=1 Tax=Lingula anatina TaxID=7574 RepID=A0A1S3HIQ9_LINAN|nr:serine/arginine-rich splicing factor 6 isoform X2 [Lingula anatina]|eukprot:XP_013385993.1 serine/arginine-rich splicing factor 6 isoform X2 [Lingula anatina]